MRVQKHRQEIIEDLKEMVKNLLKKFYSSLHQKPKRIIFYRDGVSEGQFRDVLIHELTAIQAACQELQKDPPYTPAITFLVVQKRHHARFFAVNKEDERGRSRNIPAGSLRILFIYVKKPIANIPVPCRDFEHRTSILIVLLQQMFILLSSPQEHGHHNSLSQLL